MASEFDEAWISAMDAVADGNVVLLLSPSRSHGEHEACLRLSTIVPPSETAMIWVTFIEGVDDRLGGWLDGIGEPPASSSVVAVGQADHEVTAVERDAVRVERVRDARDLPRIGITISTILEELDGDLQPALCFNSVTTLLQYAEPDRVFRFLTVLKNRLETSDAAGHYHLNPGTVDGETVTALRELCDAVVEVTQDGEASIVE